MANDVYAKYVNRVLGGNTNSLPDLDTDTIKAVLTDSGAYTVLINADQFLSDIAAGARIATATLASVTLTLSNGRTVDANDTTFTTVSGVQSEYVIGYKDTGTAGTSTLIFFMDTFSSGMPVTPNGGDIVVVWNGSGIYKF